MIAGTQSGPKCTRLGALLCHLLLCNLPFGTPMSHQKTSSNPNDFILPDLGEGVHEAELIKWRVNVGDTVAEHDILAEMETDKALVEVPSPRAGTIASLNGKEGEILNVGCVLVTYVADAQSAARPAAPRPRLRPASPPPRPRRFNPVLRSPSPLPAACPMWLPWTAPSRTPESSKRPSLSAAQLPRPSLPAASRRSPAKAPSA